MPGKLKVYISSTFLDMENARDKIINRINSGLSAYFELTEIMEKMKGDPNNRPDVDICRAEVRKADLYILLTGKRYGSHPRTYTDKTGSIVQNAGGKSYTELEYDAACETISEKFYGIYKLELTDDFFTGEKINEYTDLADAERNEKYNRFSKRLDETVSAVKVNSGAELEKTVNDKLTEFFLKYNTKQELNITLFEKTYIDRKQQFAKVQGAAINAGAFVFLIELENENDCYNEFTTRLQAELTKKQPNPDMNYVSSSAIANFTAGDNEEKKLNKLLKECSINIYGDIQNGASFGRLATDLKDIRNVFISFLIDSRTDSADGSLNFPELVAAFIKKIDCLLKEKEFPYNFYFLVYFFAQPGQQPLENYKGYFDTLPCLPMGRLPDVQLEDAKAWIEKLKTGRQVEADADSLLSMIFIDTKTFPAKYKKCIILIDKRTK